MLFMYSLSGGKCFLEEGKTCREGGGGGKISHCFSFKLVARFSNAREKTTTNRRKNGKIIRNDVFCHKPKENKYTSEEKLCTSNSRFISFISHNIMSSIIHINI